MADGTTRYAKSGELNIAYQVVGDGPEDLVFVPGLITHVELAWDQPNRAGFLNELASFSRLIVFDRRGTGMSDRVSRPATLELARGPYLEPCQSCLMRLLRFLMYSVNAGETHDTFTRNPVCGTKSHLARF